MSDTVMWSDVLKVVEEELKRKGVEDYPIDFIDITGETKDLQCIIDEFGLTVN